MTNLTPEQRVLGRENADRALGGLRRRDLLKAVAATPALGAFFFHYDMGNKPPVKAAIIGTGDEGCQAMIRSHNREYIEFRRLLRYQTIAAGPRGQRVFRRTKTTATADVKKLKKYATQRRDVC